uniref:Endonuclease/exonuclease/phosphatase domain-containing protein n=1 Tax=viral metagenome TaxID=1070528 RepID=A0A6C0HLF6_9ZZZZ
MTGYRHNWALCSNNTDPYHPKHNSVCVRNIAQVLETNPVDFVCLQESTNFKNLIKESPVLKKMKYSEHTSQSETIVTFWRPKYKLINSYINQFEEGRPYQATYFIVKQNYLCVVNVHFGHYTNEVMLEYFLQIVKKLKLVEYIAQGGRVIIAGDFNNNIKELGIFNKANNSLYLDIGGVKFWMNRTHLLTCCLNRTMHNDHIIDSLSPPIKVSIPDVEYMASDHKPIIGLLH